MSDTNAYRIAIPIGSGTLVLHRVGREPEAVALDDSIDEAVAQGVLRPDLDGSLGITQVTDALTDQLNLHLQHQ